MKYLKLEPFVVLIFTLNAQAFYQQERVSVAPKTALLEAKKLGLTISSHESIDKEEMKGWRTQKVKAHLDEIAPDPLLLEVEAGRNQIELAKVIARYEL